MNKKNRKLLETQKEIIEAVYAFVEELEYDEDIKLNNIPENLQSSIMYENKEESISKLLEIQSDLKSVIDTMDLLIE